MHPHWFRCHGEETNGFLVGSGAPALGLAVYSQEQERRKKGGPTAPHTYMHVHFSPNSDSYGVLTSNNNELAVRVVETGCRARGADRVRVLGVGAGCWLYVVAVSGAGAGCCDGSRLRVFVSNPVPKGWPPPNRISKQGDMACVQGPCPTKLPDAREALRDVSVCTCWVFHKLWRFVSWWFAWYLP